MNHQQIIAQHAAPENAIDVLVIGGGVNGTGIARDAAGRGLSVVLFEMNDLASGTSSASTKLVHGGLRYLEYFEFKLVREALIEREILLKSMPHIAWPLRLVLPIDKELKLPKDGSTFGKILNTTMPFLNGRRPEWLTRAGLFLYDNLGGREILPETKTLNLRTDPVGRVLRDNLESAFEFSDCWVEDSRLVALNARAAADLGAHVFTRTKVESAVRENGQWKVTYKNTRTDIEHTIFAKSLINAGGPWVEKILKSRLSQNSPHGVRLVRGSHIVTKKLFDHDQPYFFQLNDGRIIFAIPYETDFTLIGTTDHDHDADPSEVHCTQEERDYLVAAANQYFKTPITDGDIVWTYSGVRPLYDDGASDATSATRDYVVRLNTDGDGAPLINIFGGKITTYRHLSEEVTNMLSPFFDSMGPKWTETARLPGGNFPHHTVPRLITALLDDYTFLDERWAQRLVRAYGTDAKIMLGDATTKQDLGYSFGYNLTQKEVDWLIEKEWAIDAQDILWRRSKLGLRLSDEQVERLKTYMLKTVRA